MSGPFLSGDAPKRTVTVEKVELTGEVESPALAEALFELMRRHAKAYGLGSPEAVRVNVTAEFSSTSDAPADIDGLRAKLHELWLGGVIDRKTQEYKVEG